MSSLLNAIHIFCGGQIRSNVKDTKFVEDSEGLKGFSQFYNEKIKPRNLEMEEIRVTYLKRLRRNLRVAAIFFIIFFSGSWIYVAIALNIRAEDAAKILLLMSVMTLFWIFVDIRSFKNSKDKIKVNIFSEVFKFFGDFTFDPHGSRNIGFYEKFYIIPGPFEYDSKLSKTEDFLKGRYKNIDLSMEELRLYKKMLKSKKKVFCGVVLLFKFNKNFKGRTIVKQDKGLFGNFFEKIKIKNLQRVELEDPKFENKFEVYSQDQIEARYLITTSFMERLQKLSGLFGSKKIEASFCDNLLCIALDGVEDLFSSVSVFKEIDLVQECKRVIKEMSLIFEIVDILNLSQKTGL